MSAITVAGSKKEQIKELLKNGFSQIATASAVGCDPSYISQLMQDLEFAGEIAAHRSSILVAQAARDGKWDGLEDKLLNSLEMKIDSQGALMKTETMIRALAMVNSAKRRSIGSDSQPVAPTTIVNLTLPLMLIKQYQTNAENQVISVGGQQLIPMPAEQILKNLQEKQNKTIMNLNNQSLNTIPLTMEETPNDKARETRETREEFENSKRFEKARAITADQI